MKLIWPPALPAAFALVFWIAAPLNAEPPGADDSATHWAFQLIRRPEVPANPDSASARNPIDAFVRARLKAERQTPAPEADRRTLIRRLFLDLIGLPPTPEEVDRFLYDQEIIAVERLVDYLLARPQYGERWARHWLDVVRYAETNGYERDGAKPFAWRYRDYVIDALNRDLPYDQFMTEQLAGDEVAGSDARADRHDLHATGNVGRRAGRSRG